MKRSDREVETKVPCPRCMHTDLVLPDAMCPLCYGTGLVTPDERARYRMQGSGEYRITLPKKGPKQ